MLGWNKQTQPTGKRAANSTAASATLAGGGEAAMDIDPIPFDLRYPYKGQCNETITPAVCIPYRMYDIMVVIEGFSRAHH